MEEHRSPLVQEDPAPCLEVRVLIGSALHALVSAEHPSPGQYKPGGLSACPDRAGGRRRDPTNATDQYG